MEKKLYVGNIPYEITSAQLEELFAKAGTVASANIITDKFTGKSKGFSFIEMSTDEGAKKAIEMFNGYELSGRPIVVNEARPKTEYRSGDSDRGFSDRYSGGYGDRGGGYGGGDRGRSGDRRDSRGRGRDRRR